MDGQQVRGQAYNLSLRGMLLYALRLRASRGRPGPAGTGLARHTTFRGLRKDPLSSMGIQACLLLLFVDCHHDGLFPCTVRSACNFVTVLAPAEEVLDRVLRDAARTLGELGPGLSRRVRRRVTQERGCGRPEPEGCGARPDPA
jgi:hypothetical protein